MAHLNEDLIPTKVEQDVIETDVCFLHYLSTWCIEISLNGRNEGSDCATFTQIKSMFALFSSVNKFNSQKSSAC